MQVPNRPSPRPAAATNFSSFLRVCCGRYLALQAGGLIPADTRIPIRSLDADWELAGECAASRRHDGMAQYQNTGARDTTRA